MFSLFKKNKKKEIPANFIGDTAVANGKEYTIIDYVYMEDFFYAKALDENGKELFLEIDRDDEETEEAIKEDAEYTLIEDPEMIEGLIFYFKNAK